METTESVEIWVQTGIPENGEAIFNVHIRSGQGYEWEVSHPLSKFAAFDQLLNSLVTSLKDVAFPTLSPKAASGIALGKTREFSKEIEKCRVLLEKWVYLVVSRIQLYPIEVEDIVEDFFLLPCGPMDENEVLREPAFENSGSEAGSRYEDSTTDGSDSVFSGETMSEGGTKRPKRKRILKGIKRRFEKLTSKAPESPSASTTLVKDSERVIDQIQLGKLLKARVIRGAGSGTNVEYEIQLVHNITPTPFRCTRMFPAFKGLHDDLASASNSYSAAIISSAFPEPKSRGLGFQSDLSELELSERTRMLDVWFRDVCSTYGSLRDRERRAVRDFLKLDMSDPVCIELQDRMVRGLIEANRGAGGGNIDPTAFLGQQVSDIMLETQSDSAAMAAASKIDGGAGGSQLGRRASVKVTEGAALSPENQMLRQRRASVKVPEQERLDVIKGSLLSNKINTESSLPNKAIRRASTYQAGNAPAAALAADGATVQAPAASNPAGNTTTQRKKRSYAVTVPDSNLHIMMPKRELSTINDEDISDIASGKGGQSSQGLTKVPAFAMGEGSARSRSDSNSSNLEEKLLHIGSSKNMSSKKESAGCCCVC